MLGVLQSSPAFQQQKELFDAMSAMCEAGVDADEMPNSTGDYGLTATNPIPCRTVFGSTAYLGRLRAADGSKVAYERLGSTQSSISPHPIDIYEVKHPNDGSLATLFISPYQKRISAKAPRGFILAENSFAHASSQCIRLESIRLLFESIFPIVSESGDAMLDLHEMIFGAPNWDEDALMLTLRLIKFDVDGQTEERRLKDILEQDIIIGTVPLPRGPSVLSRSYREAVINLRHVVQHRFNLLDLNDVTPADLCFLDASKISRIWELADQ
ncbi:MAG: hypothetical protein BGN84_11055 [Afipia sp. 62-7]|nr:MAG: hypothetical protein BGN84_11055 [Afipia sp. 62-7]